MMNLIKFMALLLALVTFTTPVQAEGVLRMPGEWTPFLESISSKEFLVIENKLSQSLSDTHDMVIYDTSSYPTPRSFAITRIIGKGYILDISVHDWNTSKTIKKTLHLPTDIAERLLSVLRLCLTSRVYAPTGNAIENLDSNCVWIYLRIDSIRTLSGMVRLGEGRCLVGQGLESNRPFLDILSRLSALCTGIYSGHGNEYDAFGVPPFFMLDLAISNLQQSYPEKK